MKKRKTIELRKRKRNHTDISANSYNAFNGGVDGILNAYGTYNIQPTADTDNEFPAIAQGYPKGGNTAASYDGESN